MGQHPELESIIPHILEAAHSVVGDGLERVILYGSYVWGNRQPDSDIDVAILCADDVKISQLALMKACKFDDAIIQFYAAKASKVDSRRRFRICMDAKIANDGLVLYDSGRRYEAKDADIARTEVVRERYRHSAAALLHAMRSDRIVAREPDKTMSTFAAMTEAEQSLLRATMSTFTTMTVAKQSLLSATFTLHAYLLAHDIDPSPRVLRWSVANLLDAATWINPAWSVRKPDAAALPPEYQYPETRFLEENGISTAEAKQAMLAAIRIHWMLRQWMRKDGTFAGHPG